VPPGVRVLSLKQNPAQEWSDLRQAVMDRLKGENEALIKRLRELEDSGHVAGNGGGDDLVPRQSWEVVSKEKTELEEVVKQKEKRLLRLQQVRTSPPPSPSSRSLTNQWNPILRYSQPKARNSGKQSPQS
jgi:mitotic spindle assembly checkpoint protein MAD1